MKKRKTMSFLLAIVFSISLLLSITPCMSAESISTIVSKSTMHETTAKSTTYSTTTLSSEPVGTIYHVTGAISKRSVAGTYYYSSQKELTSPMYNSTFSNHVTRLGLSETKQMTAASSVYCVVDSEYATGTYGIYLYWSGVVLTQEVTTTTNSGTTVEQSRVISYVPCSTSKITGAKPK